MKRSSLTLQQLTLARARALAGGTASLARVLVVPEEKLEQWLSGTERIPTWAFLRTVDVLIDRKPRLCPPGWTPPRGRGTEEWPLR